MKSGGFCNTLREVSAAIAHDPVLAAPTAIVIGMALVVMVVVQTLWC